MADPRLDEVRKVRQRMLVGHTEALATAILQARRSGVAAQAIADELGVHRSYVYRLISEAKRRSA